MPAEWVRLIDPQAIAVRTALWLPPLLEPPNLPWIPISIAPYDTRRSGRHFALVDHHVLDVPARVRTRRALDGSSAPSCSSASSRRSPRLSQRAQQHRAAVRRLAAARCGRAAVWTVREPESPGYVGHHGVPSGVRIPAGPGAAQREPAVLHATHRECAQATGHDANLARRWRVC